MRAGQPAGGEDDDIIRTEGVNLRAYLVVENPAAGTHAAEILPPENGVHGLPGHLAGGQVNVEHLPAPLLHLPVPPGGYSGHAVTAATLYIRKKEALSKAGLQGKPPQPGG